MNAVLLEARNIALNYGGAADAGRVLENISLQLRRGELVAVLGASGVGKSSLLRMLAGLQTPSSGGIYMHGEPLRGTHPRLAVAFQDPALLPWLTVQKNVAFGLDFKHQPKLSKPERERRVAQAIDEVGLQHARLAYPAQLSGGMAQRAALARCLARQPDVLLLDEPFGALDEITRADMQQLLLQLVREHGTAAVLITHDIDEALLLADRILLLGGAPAQIVDTWPIELRQPREQWLRELTELRVDIVQTLRHANRPDNKTPGDLPCARTISPIRAANF